MMWENDWFYQYSFCKKKLQMKVKLEFIHYNLGKYLIYLDKYNKILVKLQKKLNHTFYIFFRCI